MQVPLEKLIAACKASGLLNDCRAWLHRLRHEADQAKQARA